MSKKTKNEAAIADVSMSALSKLTPDGLASISLNGQLDIGDVIAIVTSRAEQTYNDSIARCLKEIKGLEDEIKDVETEFKQVLADEGSKLVPNLENLKAELKKVGFTVYVTYKLEEDNSKLVCLVTVKDTKSSSYGVQNTLTGTPSKSLLSRLERIKKLREQVVVIQAEALEWKKKKQNIPMLERRVRANISEAKLRSTADGKALLDAITADMDSAIANLSSV